MPGQQSTVLHCKSAYFTDSDTFDDIPVSFATTTKTLLAATVWKQFFWSVENVLN
jgi:hypothetical protein